MVQAVNSKQNRYDPARWMANRKDIARRRDEAAGERRPMTGDEVLRRFRALGVPIVDNRSKK